MLRQTLWVLTLAALVQPAGAQLQHVSMSSRAATEIVVPAVSRRTLAAPPLASVEADGDKADGLPLIQRLAQYLDETLSLLLDSAAQSVGVVGWFLELLRGVSDAFSDVDESPSGSD